MTPFVAWTVRGEEGHAPPPIEVSMSKLALKSPRFVKIGTEPGVEEAKTIWVVAARAAEPAKLQVKSWGEVVLVLRDVRSERYD